MVAEFFDVHTHLNIKFTDDWASVGQRALADGVQFVNVGTDEASSRLALSQAEFFETGVWSTAGLHPHEAGAKGDLSWLTELAGDQRVLAIGECGLDYFRPLDESVKLKQQDIFVKQLELALLLDKPLMIHCRQAEADLWPILNDYKRQVGDRLRFNLHFFTGDWSMAKRFLDLDGYLSFPGVITFSDQSDQAIKNMPLDRLLSETDAPFATPVPYRGKRNEPAYVRLVAEHLATLRPEARTTVLPALLSNAKKFFARP